MKKGDVAKIHRTVQWCTGLPGEPTVATATVDRAIRGRRVAHSNGRLGTSDCPVCTEQCPVRQPTPRTNGWKVIAHRTATVTVWWCTRLSGAPPDRRQVWPPTAPSCLGDIKGTPRCMEELTKEFTKHPMIPTLCLRAFDRLC
jgi:hypothetical protein